MLKPGGMKSVNALGPTSDSQCQLNRIAVTSGPTTRVELIDECPGDTSRSDPRSSTHSNPEEEGCCSAPKREGKEKNKVAREDECDRRTNKEDTMVGELTEVAEIERAEENSEKSNEAERAWKTEIPAKDRQMPKDTKIACHVPGGTWLLQIRDYLQNPSSYFGSGKGRGEA
ncbi:hypothetical protein NDU88_005828 [Pleurodeles waltl]|uniref:Uncharacterized protein n=1 Tax=Pleurodeles waltl TaxID=8319 RepID=A0AAV7PGT7_PLEWA|nr:hypothetical protein NDU88_005828 [Pleurodeles waltl]